MVSDGEEGAGCAEALGTKFVDEVFRLGNRAALTEFCICGQRGQVQCRKWGGWSVG